MRRYGFLRVGASNHPVKLADVDYNKERILEVINQAKNNKVDILVFPELNLSGYTCMDGFNYSTLIEKAFEALLEIAKKTKGIMFSVGLPMLVNNRLYSVSAIVNDSQIIGFVPRKIIDKKSVYEKNFSLFCDEDKTNIIVNNKEVKFDYNLKFVCNNFDYLSMRVLSSQDSFYESDTNCTLILNPTANPDFMFNYKEAGKNSLSLSKRDVNCVITANAGYGESTSDNVFSGGLYINELGKNLVSSKKYQKTSKLVYQDIDFEKISNMQRKFKVNDNDNCDVINFNLENNFASLERNINKSPFIPEDKNEWAKEMRDVFNMMSFALENRIDSINARKIVIGVSGGVDSTLAFLTAVSTAPKCGLNMEDIIAITMPGFGTSKTTKDNANILMDMFGVTKKTIPINKATEVHLRDIGHNMEEKNVVYENAQARERTQILLDYANKVSGIVLGTGDLSEAALGFCTFGGDHMYNYGVNASLPKTLMKEIIKYVGIHSENDDLIKVLYDIIDTPISPELLPTDDGGKIAQKTESIVGPYELHDFFIYNMLYYNFSIAKTYFLAKKAFEKEYTKNDIKKYLKIFMERFFASQFKRQSAPENPKLTNVSLSQRGGFDLSTQMNKKIWLEELEKEV